MNGLPQSTKEPVSLKYSDQFQRYFLLPETEVPQNLRCSEMPARRLRTDYGYACKSNLRFWKKRQRASSQQVSSSSSALSGVSLPILVPDSEYLKKCTIIKNRDTVGKIMMDPGADGSTVGSEYRDTFEYSAEKNFATCSVSRAHHMKVNPISKFGEALFVQRETIRN